MSEWTLPNWLTLGGSADVVTWAGFILTCWIGWQAKSIKDYFFNRVRIGEIIPELSIESQSLFKALGEWGGDGGDSRTSHLAISRIRGRLLNLKTKLTSEEKKSLVAVLSKIDRKRYFVIPSDVSGICFEQAWEIARDLDGMIVQIDGGHKDSGWRQR